jgi:signal transduction histidine kinase
MGHFWEGLLIGVIGCLVIAAIIALSAIRRFVLLERRARESERLAELGTLTGGLAHEIKNPLSTVQLNLQLLAEDLSPENPAHPRIINRLKTVQKETTRLREILDDFLRYAGKIELDRQPTDINDLLEDLVDFFLPQAQQHKAKVRLKRFDQPLIAPIDARLIKQAVLNLMLNALQAMPEGGDLILSASKEDGQAIIDIIDTGRGIPKEAVDKIFQAYYTSKKGGTGLGLAMTQRIVKEHGGSLNVKSEPGKGSDFTLRLPMKG